MAQTTVSISLDEELKNSFEEVCQDIGLSLNAAITVFAKKVSREMRIPFELTADPFYSESNQNALTASFKELEEGKVVIKTLDELQAMEIA